MILVPDIHINAKHGHKILHLLRTITDVHKDDQIIFLGDYVYTFSYDRAILLELFSFFVSLHQQGRQIVVMSGNHDRIAGRFVFEEGKQSFDILNDLSSGSGSLRFVTQPYSWVQDDVLHIVLPYNDALQEPSHGDYYDAAQYDTDTDYVSVIQEIQQLNSSSKTGERLSALINRIVLTYYLTNRHRFTKIVCYHHYYIAHRQFPGVQSVFGYQHIALMPIFCQLPGLYLISGHIHEPFVADNYLCCGSLWHTSSNEVNECKYYFTGNVQEGFRAHMIHTNPKISLVRDGESALSAQVLDSAVSHIVSQSLVHMEGEMVRHIYPEQINLSIVDLFLQAPAGSSNIMALESLLPMVSSYKIMKKDATQDVSGFSILVDELKTSFIDRKQLLLQYLQTKYPDDYNAYIDFMRNNDMV